jgi:hypothetical protein
MNILIGYSDSRRATKPTIIAGPEVTRDAQMKLWIAAKQKHQFPKGISEVVLMECVEIENAIFISDDVTEQSAAYAAAAARREADAKSAKAAVEKAAAEKAAAQKAVDVTAVARNAASFALNIAKQNNADKAKVAAAQLAFDQADKAWTDAKARRDALGKPAENKIEI